MNRLILTLFFLASLGPVALGAAEKANTVLLHPGEAIYARFEQKGKKLKLVDATKEKNELAQVVLSLSANKEGGLTLKVENRFKKDLLYRAELRSLTLKLRVPATVYPVVAEKMAIERLPPGIEEMAIYGFALQQ